ncbi:hypothetical protein GGX14DRAFT_392057 [Mycena pura]|uniref:Uncharacterized protein n=1 Tax=Mycena pura TaxID=153505 RepID=A0AAD6VKE7_9AGAR|nr:hypothetical protein GGX14DRAFT_392057 [Mycena pura]
MRWQHDPQRAARSRLLLVACRSSLVACRSLLAARCSLLVAASRSLPAALAHVALAHVALPAARARIVIVPLPRPPPSNLHVPPPAASRCSHVRHRCRPLTASCHPHQLPAIRARAVQDQLLVLLVVRCLLPAVPSPCTESTDGLMRSPTCADVSTTTRRLFGKQRQGHPAPQAQHYRPKARALHASSTVTRTGGSTPVPSPSFPQLPSLC